MRTETKAPFDEARRIHRLRHNENLRICRRCGKSLPKGRRSYCGDECADEQAIRSNVAFARHKVWERDKGVCSACGLDTERLSRVLYAANRFYLRVKGYHHWSVGHEILYDLGFKPGQSLWEADHIRPVADGGGGCGLDNLRTLCVPCHKAITRQWHREKKTMRRVAKGDGVQADLL